MGDAAGWALCWREGGSSCRGDGGSGGALRQRRRGRANGSRVLKRGGLRPTVPWVAPATAAAAATVSSR